MPGVTGPQGNAGQGGGAVAAHLLAWLQSTEESIKGKGTRGRSHAACGTPRLLILL